MRAFVTRQVDVQVEQKMMGTDIVEIATVDVDVVMEVEMKKVVIVETVVEKFKLKKVDMVVAVMVLKNVVGDRTVVEEVEVFVSVTDVVAVTGVDSVMFWVTVWVIVVHW